MEKEMNATMYNDNCIGISVHPSPTSKSNNRKPKRKHYLTENMTRDNLSKSSNSKRKQIQSLSHIEEYRLKFITLTVDHEVNINCFRESVSQFIDRFRKKYKNFSCVRAIECNEEPNRYHEHIIFIFRNKAPQLDIK